MRNERPFDFLAALVGTLREAAAAEDAGAPLTGSVAAVMASGALDERRPDALARTLVTLAEANLPVARLAEGHVNAQHLLDLHAPGACPEGAILGVWGADGANPVRLDGKTLVGSKRYASGLGILTHALITVADGGECRLALVDVTDPARHRPGTWSMLGMRATVSGDVEFDGLSPLWIGEPGAYHVEPTFVGGVWRIAALQLGGTLGLLGAARDYLADLRPAGRGGAGRTPCSAPRPGLRRVRSGRKGRGSRAGAAGPRRPGPAGRAVDPGAAPDRGTGAGCHCGRRAVGRPAALRGRIGNGTDRARSRDLLPAGRARRDGTAVPAASLLGGSGPLSAIWHG